jgi:hypothetical protein
MLSLFDEGMWMGLYDRLERRLANEKATDLELSFDEIEMVLGKPLPKVANRPSFWENPSNREHFSGMKKAIKSAGFLAHLVDGQARVRFVKVR